MDLASRHVVAVVGSKLSCVHSAMIGPTLPPHLRRDKSEKAENNDSDGDEDAYGPALPPALAASRAQPVPAPEPTVDDESSDDEIGPRPPAPSTSRQAPDDGIREFLERERRRKELAEVRKSVINTNHM
jgi:hypothetical protein